ncbi:ROK family protein [Plantactinospora sp. GCM10030261]|uniref:ROK family protein n=1 Tax=Plantactinospora sp. GCM10030261 TaxID=3273420 RepID=UPI003620850E
MPATSPLRQASLREHNLGVVLRAIAAAERAPSRADLAADTGLTRATVSALIDDLLRGGLLAEVAPAPRSGAGRPATGLVLADHGPAGLGLEINVDYLAACVVDLAGTVRHRAVRRLDLRGTSPPTALDGIAALADRIRLAAERDGLTLAGTALAVPALVDPTGMVRRAPNLGWQEVDVPAALARLPGPLSVDNEANLAAVGELHARRGSPSSFLYVSGEIGVGAGVVLDSALFRGAGGFGGELGHLPVEPAGRRCRCGARGCLEQYAGQEAILTGAGLAVSDGAPDRALNGLVEAANGDDPAARAAIDRAGRALGVALAGAVNLLDVPAVVLGGCYARLAPWLLPAVREELAERVLTAAWRPVRVHAALLGADAAVLGAAGSVIRSVLARPASWLATRPEVRPI